MTGNSRKNNVYLKSAFVVTAIFLAACANFRNLRHDLDSFEGHEIVEIDVVVENWSGAPIIVAAVVEPNPGDAFFQVARQRTLSEPHSIQLALEHGTYLLVALEDGNRNGEPDEGERGVVSPPVELIAVDDEDHVTPVSLVVSEVFQRPASVDGMQRLDDEVIVVGEQASLDDPRFGSEVGQLGLWQPVSFIEEHRAGVYMLEPYDSSRTPVIFIHGMTGYPQEFAHIIEGLDRSRYQPWIFHYPSGAEIDLAGQVLSQIVAALQTRHGFERHYIVAHSMGGLVSWAYLNEQFEGSTTPTAKGLVTIASPLGGMPSAAWGVRFAPTVAPAWQDLAPGSEFLESLFSGPVPEDFEYHLLFMWQDDGSSDGTVPLPSQIRADAQARATFMHGFEASHAGCLRVDEVRDQVYTALNRFDQNRAPVSVTADGTE